MKTYSSLNLRIKKNVIIEKTYQKEEKNIKIEK